MTEYASRGWTGKNEIFISKEEKYKKVWKMSQKGREKKLVD